MVKAYRSVRGTVEQMQNFSSKEVNRRFLCMAPYSSTIHRTIPHERGSLALLAFYLSWVSAAAM